MNPFPIHTRPDEIILARERLHWSIFILPVFLLCALVLPQLFIIAVFEKIAHQFIALAGPAGRSSSQFPFQAILIALAALPGLGAFIVTFAAYLKSEVTLTDRRLMFRTGLIFRTSGESPLENVEAIYITESIFGRLLGYGTVAATTLGGASFPLPYIASPQRFHTKLQEAVLTAKLSTRQPTLKTTTPPPDDHSRYMPKYLP
jgi:uncharacterized membrane protein YdbT with pleckstrin-like domain